jgi:hypothetical protein
VSRYLTMPRCQKGGEVTGYGRVSLWKRSKGICREGVNDLCSLPGSLAYFPLDRTDHPLKSYVERTRKSK